MNSRSIRTSITLLAGACILAVVAALIAYTLFAGQRTRALVDSHTEALAATAAEARLTAEAEAVGNQLQRQLDVPLQLASQLAQLNVAMASPGDQQVELDRQSLVRLLGQSLKRQSGLLSLYTVWEPDAIDGQDDRHRGDAAAGYDERGRFTPWWHKTLDGDVTVEPIGPTVESQTRLPSGVTVVTPYHCTRPRGADTWPPPPRRLRPGPGGARAAPACGSSASARSCPTWCCPTSAPSSPGA